jgi:hypothetical protein
MSTFQCLGGEFVWEFFSAYPVGSDRSSLWNLSRPTPLVETGLPCRPLSALVANLLGNFSRPTPLVVTGLPWGIFLGLPRW